MMIRPGVYLHTQEELMEQQKDWDEPDESKTRDFSTHLAWISTDDGYLAGYDVVEGVLNAIGDLSAEESLAILVWFHDSESWWVSVADFPLLATWTRVCAAGASLRKLRRLVQRMRVAPDSRVRVKRSFGKPSVWDNTQDNGFLL